MRQRRMQGLMMVAVGSLGLFGCQEAGTYKMDPFQVPCEGLMPQMCLQGTEVATGEVHRFYEGIEGFTFTWGEIQTIEVFVEEVPDPPEDGSSLRYELKERVSQETVPEGSTFEVTLSGKFIRGSQADGYTLVGEVPLMCSSQVCDALEQRRNTLERFSLELHYPTSEGGPLEIERVF